jgi:hypothetical protein
MKKKDTIYLVLAVLIFLVVGYVGYTQVLAPKKGAKAASAGVTVEKIGVIPSSLDQSAVSQLSNAALVQDFNSPVDLSGLGNNAPFGP